MTNQKLNLMLSLRLRLGKLESRRQSIISTSGLGAAHIDGMPHRNAGVADPVAHLIEDLEVIDERIEQIKDQITCIEPEVDAFIRSIADTHLMVAFRLRYIHGLAFRELYPIACFPSEEAAKRAILQHVDAMVSKNNRS